MPLFVARVILPDSSGLPVLQISRPCATRWPSWRRSGCRHHSRPVDLSIDHSLQVDHAALQAIVRNLTREFERNDERYRFAEMGAAAFRGLRVFPPGTGIIHQVNLEHIATGRGGHPS